LLGKTHRHWGAVMREITVKVNPDHLARISKVKKPLVAVAELIWNALDADATQVSVTLKRNTLGGFEYIRVKDNGHGIPYDDAIPAFENLGGSWKKGTNRSRTKDRLLHGKAGKGRFRAFALGDLVEWHTRYTADGKSYKLVIRGSGSNLGRFEVEEPTEVKGSGTGTDVLIDEIGRNLPSLLGDEALQMLTEYFALYLSAYKDIHIDYDGTAIEPHAVMRESSDYNLEPITLKDGPTVRGVLTIIEWNAKVDRSFYLCDENGFALQTTSPGIHAPGYYFSAYLKSEYMRELDDDNLLELDEMHEGLRQVIEQAKSVMRDHFRVRSAQAAAEQVQGWKRDKIYPYEGKPTDLLDRTERQIFDVCALNLASYLPDFEGSHLKQKRMAFQLLRHAIEVSPAALQKIFFDVLELPADKRDELAQLLERTTLAAIINAARTVADRLDFLKGLEILVFDPQSKEQLLERSQLHRMIADQTWFFGEQFHLSVDDQSLTEVLRRHLGLLGREELVTHPVLDDKGKAGIVDLMLSRRIPQPHAEQREHLVIELKRPSQTIDTPVETQITNYAFAVAEDDRFRDTDTTWVFWAISNKASTAVERKANQAGRPPGLLYDDPKGRIFIWVRTWGQLIESCRGRLEFFRSQLDYNADNDSAIGFLRETYRKYLPDSLAD